MHAVVKVALCAPAAPAASGQGVQVSSHKQAKVEWTLQHRLLFKRQTFLLVLLIICRAAEKAALSVLQCVSLFTVLITFVLKFK